jgi:3-dehydroquinate dehydratase II
MENALPLIFFLNGPNANLYGLDKSGIYGADSFETLRARCLTAASGAGVSLDFRQTNYEGELIDWIQEARTKAAGLIINGAGLTYTSIAVLDALLAYDGPIIEVHMSNIWKREPFRHHSYISRAATAVIAGLGGDGYELAVQAMARRVRPAEAVDVQV